MIPQFTVPSIVTSDKKDWYVYFKYLVDGTYKPIKLREGVNRIKNTKDRLATIKALAEARHKWLKAGWNPINNTFPEPEIDGVELSIKKLQEMTFSRALQYGFNQKKSDWSSKTISDYTSLLKFTKSAVLRTGVGDFPITDIKAFHCRLVIEEVVKMRKLGNTAFNKYRDFLSTIMGQISDDDIIEYNPIKKIKYKEEVIGFAHKPPTKDERKLIMTRIKTYHREYYRFLAVLYGCTLRPKEIINLKIKNLHRQEQVVRIYPDGKGASKTKFAREVAIPDWLMPILMEMNLHAYSPECYIFSGRTKNLKENMFLPGERKMHPNSPTNWWRNIVKAKPEDGGLGLSHVDQYSLKKLAGNDMVKLYRKERVNDLLAMPQMQMGHASPQMTEIYVTEHQEIMKEVIKKGMPEL